MCEKSVNISLQSMCECPFSSFRQFCLSYVIYERKVFTNQLLNHRFPQTGHSQVKFIFTFGCCCCELCSRDKLLVYGNDFSFQIHQENQIKSFYHFWQRSISLINFCICRMPIQRLDNSVGWSKLNKWFQTLQHTFPQ